MLLVVGAIALSAVGARTAWVYLAGGAMIPLSMNSVSTSEARSILVRAGLDAEVLAAAGVTSQQVVSIVEAAIDESSSVAASLNTADADVRSAKQNCDRLTRIVESGTATEQQKADLVTARTALVAGRNAQQVSLDQVFDAAAGEMGESQSRIASRVRANRHWSLPLHHLAVPTDARTESDWIHLREALSHKASIQRCGDEECSVADGVIAASEAIADVAAAKTSLAANAQAVSEAWLEAINGS